MAFGPDGRLFVAATDKIVAYDAQGKAATIADGLCAQGLAVTSRGNLYVAAADKLWLVTADGQKRLLDSGLSHPTGVVPSPDGLWLAVAESKTHWGYSYRIQPDGTVEYKQRFYWFHAPDWADDSGVRAWCADRDGRLYAATRMGVEVFDRNGRVRCILPPPRPPAREHPVTGVSFDGAKFDVLYVTSGGKVYKRTLKVPGAPAWAPPIRLPRWGAG